MISHQNFNEAKGGPIHSTSCYITLLHKTATHPSTQPGCHSVSLGLIVLIFDGLLVLIFDGLLLHSIEPIPKHIQLILTHQSKGNVNDIRTTLRTHGFPLECWLNLLQCSPLLIFPWLDEKSTVSNVQLCIKLTPLPLQFPIQSLPPLRHQGPLEIYYRLLESVSSRSHSHVIGAIQHD